jgi:hypothetical protein
LKILPFSPGRGWTKKGLPSLTMDNTMDISRNTGNDSINTVMLSKMSDNGLMIFRYITG